MAIAYSSAGAGASSETSGAAVSPASPAVVAANDILIIHAYFEGTATAPDTPSGFTLLSGPIAVEAVGRHWIYGKIAAGTEDGAANALGSQAVTTMRSGRCYSFTGFSAGTITDLVRGFATTTHATDPQMPTVTTTVAGGLAVACVAQNDNNASISATGESGGDWVEAVAEYVAALTPGLSLALQTCTPTANPGTVSGGTIATTNDPCGVIGFEIRPNAPAEVVGTSSSTLSDVTGSAAGSVSVNGDSSSTLSSVTGSAEGVVSAAGIFGESTVALDSITGSADGSVTAAPVVGTSSVALDDVTGSADGFAALASGTSTAAVDSLTGSASGSVTTPVIKDFIETMVRGLARGLRRGVDAPPDN